MKYADFVAELENAGWKPLYDADYYNIKVMWAKLFPIIAELEKEVFELECTLEDLK